MTPHSIRLFPFEFWKTVANPSLLDRLALNPEQVDLLPKKVARSVVDFLLRWEAFVEALGVLDLWQDDGFVTTMDARARALSGMGQHAEAAALMEQRVAAFRSLSSEQLLGEMLIRAGRIDDAQDLARRMREMAPDRAGGWALLGDVLLVRRDLVAAEHAYLRYQEVAPQRLEPAIGLATLSLLRNDPVTASAYASRAWTLASEGGASVLELKVLLEIVEAIPDENQVREIRSALVERFDRELAAMVEQVESAAPRGSRRRAARDEPPVHERRTAEALHQPSPQSQPSTDLASLAVDAQEVRRYTEAAHRLFGFSTLLPAQAQILSLAGRGENVLAILPTGGGKSLCYQLPAFLDFVEGGAGQSAALRGDMGPLTLVVSPLIALMKDQIENLPPALAAHTLALNSAMSGADVQRGLAEIANGRYRLVYAAPERLRLLPFLDVLRRRGLARLVIDEAHCVSSWGHNFRPDYMHIAQAHRDLGAPPILALTATAPTRVRQDIEQHLVGRSAGAPRMTVIAADSFRPNLLLSAIRVADVDDKQAALLGLCLALEGSGIVYARTRALTEELAALLESRGESAEAFHAGISPAERAAIQERFIGNETRILVATVAFGMGIDKPDIRFILHFGLPSSLEAYYQEAGRAGRDGQPARCVLLYSSSDKSILTGLVNREALSVDFLRAVWQQARRLMKARNPGAVAMDDLVREMQVALASANAAQFDEYKAGEKRADDTKVDETKVRVALGLLEQAGLLERRYDIPRGVSLFMRTLPRAGDGAEFAQRIRLNPSREMEFGYMDLCQQSGVDPGRLEAALLDWQAEGWLHVASSGRDLLITIPPAPADAQQRVAALVDRLQAVRHQQVQEIYAYARTRSCRHGYLAAHLGGVARAKCHQCDNCGAGALPEIDSGLPSDAEQTRIIVEAARERVLGPRTLARVLHGDARVGPGLTSLRAYGTLKYRSEVAITHLIDDLVERGTLTLIAYDNGATVITVRDRR